MFEAAELYQRDGTELIILAGKDYGSGSSRDWVAKGPHLLVTSHDPASAGSTSRIAKSSHMKLQARNAEAVSSVVQRQIVNTVCTRPVLYCAVLAEVSLDLTAE